MKKLLAVFCFISTMTFSQSIALTENGKIQGTEDQGIQIYKGIPFAAPPLGNLRWQAPKAVKNWSGIKKCVEFGPSPIQNKPQPFMCWTEEFIAQPEPLSEDCLYLNVWTKTKAKNSKLPVFVWIYGGGLSSGSANCAIYDGLEMAKQGVVFVSINYRVGVLGFMAHPELSAESPGKASGNYGFLDQIAALKWVQKNIKNFGGDPNNVTIAGQSAGAFSVNALIASPLAKGLFQKAIPQSGGLLSNRLSQDLKTAEKQGVTFMEKANCKTLADLRKVPADEIQKLSNQQSVGRFGVTMDGYVLPVNILEHFKSQKNHQVTVLTGWVTGDGGLFGEPKGNVTDFEAEAKTKYGADAEAFLKLFPAKTDQEVTTAKKLQALMSFAAMPSHLLAIYSSKPAYLYQFNRVPPDKPNFPNYGAFHTSEVPYALHTLHTWKRDWTETDKNLEKTMSAYWVNFAKTGNPNGPGLPEWKIYTKTDGHILELADQVKDQPAMFKKTFDFLETHN